MSDDLVRIMRTAFDESMRTSYGNIDERQKTAWRQAALAARSHATPENALLLADNRRLQRERAKLRSTLREAIALVEKQGGYVVGADVKALAARGSR